MKRSLQRLRHLLRSLVQRRRVESEMDEEIEFHLKARAEHLMQLGIETGQAHRRAKLEFGPMATHKHDMRNSFGLRAWDNLNIDLRSAIRSLISMRLIAAVVVLTLALGIAANLIVFTLVNVALLKPLPFNQPDQVVVLDDQVNGQSAGVSWGEIQELTRLSDLFGGAAAYSQRTWGLTDSSGGALTVVESGMVSPGFFHVLETVPVLGRTFDPKENNGTDEQQVVISHELWQSRYRRDPTIVGQTLKLNEIPYRIIGVLPDRYELPLNGPSPDLYIPLARKDYCCQKEARGLIGIARLASARSILNATEQLRIIMKDVASHEHLRSFTVQASPLQSFLVKDHRKTLLFLWAAVTILGIIAALNAGAVLLARSLRNLRQYALKISLGASIRHLVMEQIAQATLLAFLASGVSLGLAYLALKGLRASPLFEPLLGGIFRKDSVWDWRVLCFGVLLSLGAALCACLLPLLLLRRMSVDQVLRSHTGLSSSREGRRIRTTLIVVQLSLSVMLVSSATSFGHTIHSLLVRNPGFRSEGVVMGGIGVPEARYDTDEKMLSFHANVIDQLHRIPGVGAAGFAAGAPINPLSTRFLIDGTSLPITQRPRADIAFLSPEMFQVLGLRFLRGHAFSEVDRVGQPYVAVVNEAFAKKYLEQVDPFRKGMIVSFYNGVSMKPWSHYDILGIVADSRNRALDREPEPEIYASTLQVPLEGGDYFLETKRDAASLVNELPAAVWQVDPEIQKVEPMTLQSYIQEGFTDRRLTFAIFLGFAAIALLLASTGLASSISAAVSESTKEIGIRSALGESRTSVSFRILRSSLLKTMIGTAVGIVGSLALSRVAAVRFTPHFTLDRQSLCADVGLMFLIAIIVSLWPVRRALSIAPVEALRTD